MSDEFSQEDFESEFDKLRNKLGKLLTTKTGRVINLGNGLSAEHVLFVMMNYATPKTKSWKGSEWKYDTMKPTEGCIGFWRQSVITCLEREVGTEKTVKHKSSCISTQDRLFWTCNTNKSDYVDEIDDVCEDADISEDTMHLIPIILLALKVKYARMNGHMPSILATGSPVRDNLFEVEDTLITRHAIFAGSVPHSEMFMRKDRFLHAYPDTTVHHKYSQRLAVFYSQRFFTTSECTFTENWTGLGNLSPKEMKEFREEHKKLMQEICIRGGMTTGELAQLASALYAVDWNHDDLSPVMQLRFAWCLEHKNRHKKKNKFDEDDFIKFLTKLCGSRSEGGKIGGNKGAKTTNEMQTLASKLHKVDGDYNKLSTELRFAFDLIHASYNNRHKDEIMNREQFIKFLTELRDSRVEGGEKGGVKGGSAKTEAKKKTAPWNGIKSRMTQEEKDLLDDLKDIIVPVVNDIKFTKSDKLGGANDELLEKNLLAALLKFDKTNPTNVKSLLWTHNKHQDFKNVTKDERGRIKGQGGEYIDFDYYKDLYFVVTCNSSTLAQGLVAKSRAHIEMQVITRALLIADITHHQKKENKEKIQEYVKNLMKTVVERSTNKKRKRV